MNPIASADVPARPRMTTIGASSEATSLSDALTAVAKPPRLTLANRQATRRTWMPLTLPFQSASTIGMNQAPATPNHRAASTVRRTPPERAATTTPVTTHASWRPNHAYVAVVRPSAVAGTSTWASGGGYR